jgi:peptidyl-prolyl cis-trans isomerase SurA
MQINLIRISRCRNWVYIYTLFESKYTKMFLRIIYAFTLMLVMHQHLRAQQAGQVIDQIAAVVGNNVIMHSEIVMEFKQLKKEFGQEVHDSFVCSILRQRMLDNVLLHKAIIDSVMIAEDRVEHELERRIRYFAQQFGGIRNMEDFYGKSIAKIKDDNREKIRQNLIITEMQQKALKDVKVSPNDVRKFFNNIPEDSLPYYSAEVEVSQIVYEPKVSDDAKKIAYDKISELRERIINGDNFSTLAIIYSDDKGSAVNGGELGFFTRGDMVPEFEAAAFKLKPDSISRVIESKYGYHILKLVDRKGENINVRHILIRPQIFKSDIQRAKEVLDSIIWMVKIDSMTFENAAKKFSDDPSTKGNGGFITEPNTGTTRIPIDELDQSIYFRIESMNPGDISEPELITIPGPDRQQVWRVFYMKSEIKPHQANLKDDYQKFQALALQDKQAKALNNYIERARKGVYIRVSPLYMDCIQVKDLITNR